jgi:pimeloyl-ACP methyl ester carboxylesterase
MQIQMTRLGAFALGLGLALVVTASAAAQTAEAPPRLVTVEGGAMRVWAAGLEQRGVGQPVVVLEAGAGAGLENWRPVFAEIAKRFPVLAYDRRGIGQSDADSETPTLRRVASWGGLFVRAFTEQFPSEVSGQLFLDVTDFETTNEERAAAVSPEERMSQSPPRPGLSRSVEVGCLGRSRQGRGGPPSTL